jgi:hypothetical protein
MNFKKIALALAVASSFAAQAAEPAAADYLTQFQSAEFFADGAQAAVYTDFLAAATDGNTAYVFQNGGEAAGSVAFVTQADGANYAAVIQSGVGALAYVNQIGGGALNKAMIMQVETGETARETALTATSSVDQLAAAELGGRELSVTGNVALVSQVAGDAENSAFIYQNGTSNFAAVSQTGNVANFAYVTQMGAGSVAYILQK